MGLAQAKEIVWQKAVYSDTRYATAWQGASDATRDALVTVTVRGALGEVEAAVAAGATAAACKGEVLARHVIPAPDGQLEEPIAGPAPAAATRGNDTTP